MQSTFSHRIGVDENGLGARLGPLVVTAVLAEVNEQGARLLSRKVPKRIAADLGDSKDLVSHGDVSLGEAWARALLGGDAASPTDLFERLSLEGSAKLRTPCPSHVEHQCWGARAEAFSSDDLAVRRMTKHLEWWRERGIVVRAVRSSVACTKRLNDDRATGKNRFVSDLHAMEELILSLRTEAGADLLAVCGKVGGIEDYSRFFGPLSMRLHTVLDRSRALSAYGFPGIGEVRFVRDADSKDPLVMLASMVGKYVRELLMARVTSYYSESLEVDAVSGYHDPVTDRFVDATALLRKKRKIPDPCFERARDES